MRELQDIATIARDEFLGAWDESGRKGNVFDHHGDDLAHINHIAEGDYGVRDLDRDLLIRLYNAAAEMTRDNIDVRAPTPELDVLVAATIYVESTGGTGDTVDKIVDGHTSKQLRSMCPDFDVCRPRGATKREAAELLAKAEPEWADDIAQLRE